MTLVRTDNSTPLGIRRKERILGNIRMGEKDAGKGFPKKLDRFRITSPSRRAIDAVQHRYGGEVTEWENSQFQVTLEEHYLHVLIPPITSYNVEWSLWTGPGKCDRRCDGERMTIKNGKRLIRNAGDDACMCGPDQFERACKPHIRAKFILDGLDIQLDGVWVLDSHGFNAAAELPVTMDKLTAISRLMQTQEGSLGSRKAGGQLSIEHRTSKANGKTRQFIVPVLDPDVAEDIVADIPGYAAAMQAAYNGRSLPAAPATFGETPALPEQTADFTWSEPDADTSPAIEAEARIVEEPENRPELGEPSAPASAEVPAPQPEQPHPDKGAMQHYIITCNQAQVSEEQQREWLEAVTDGKVTSRKDGTKADFGAALEHGLNEFREEAGDLAKRVFGVRDEDRAEAARQMVTWIGRPLKEAGLSGWHQIVRELRQAIPKPVVNEAGEEEQELPW